MTGTIGLGIQNKFPDKIDERSEIIKILAKRGKYLKLAIYATGVIKQQYPVQQLSQILDDNTIDNTGKVMACKALGRIGGKQSGNILKAQMASGDIYLLLPAFYALVTMREKCAIPLAIAAFDAPSHRKYERSLAHALEYVTQKPFGTDGNKWKDWWKHEGKTWTYAQDHILDIDD